MDSLRFTINFPEIVGTRFLINLWRMINRNTEIWSEDDYRSLGS